MMAVARCSRVEAGISCTPLGRRGVLVPPSGHAHSSQRRFVTPSYARAACAQTHKRGACTRTDWGSFALLRDNDPVTSATVPTTTAASEAWFARARAVTPGGVNSPVRAFTAVGGTPRFITSAPGAWLTDADGNEYVDLICSWGPMLLGHAHPDVQAAVMDAVPARTSYGTPTVPEVELAEEIVARTPVERVRFVSSGTEATMSAIRLARGATGRDLVVKFAGCYHGHVDAAAGRGRLGRRDARGARHQRRARDARPPRRSSCPTTTGPPCRPPSRPTGPRIACLITEASPGNMGVVPPAPGFNAFLAETCRAHGALFISDEVMTGFRATAQGGWGLDGAVEGWTPDLMTFGKVMGGGFPAAAFGGRADLMGHLAPEGPVYQAGTLSGNPVATTAGLTTLRLATPEVYAQSTPPRTTVRGPCRAPAGGRRPARRPDRRHDVLGVLPRRRGARLRRGEPAGHPRLRRVLPLDARPGRLPAPVGVRGVVRLRGTRRAGRVHHHRRPAGRGVRAAAAGGQ